MQQKLNCGKRSGYNFSLLSPLWSLQGFFRLNLEEFTLDLLPDVPGLSRFRTSYDRKLEAKSDGITVPLISYEDLIISKEKLGRAKDIEDIKELGSRKGRKK